MRLAIVILNHRTAQLAVDCLASLAGQLDAEDRAFVVDNGSNDGSLDTIGSAIQANGWEEKVEIVPLPRNVGFSAGNNHLLRTLCAPFYLLLNSDTLVPPGAIAGLLAAAAEHRRAGVIGPRIEWPDATPQASFFRFPSVLGELLLAAGIGPLERLFVRHRVWQPPPDVPDEGEWVSFAAVLIRRELLEQIGLLDEGFFMYYEDVDFCRRARAAGWRVLYWPDARVVHLLHGPYYEAASTRARLPSSYYASRSRYFAKHHGRNCLWAANLAWLIGLVLARVRETIQRRASHLPSHAARDVWTNWRRPLETEARPRRETSRRR